MTILILHFHQLIMRFLEIRFFGRQRRRILNPLSTLILVPLISAPQVVGVLFWDNLEVTVWLTVVIALLFVITYLVGIRMAKIGRGSLV